MTDPSRRKTPGREDSITPSLRKRLGGFLRQRLIVVVLTVYLLGLAVVRQVELLAGEPLSEDDKNCSLRAIESPDPLIVVETTREPPVKLKNRSGTINDASCLNRTPVYGVLEVTDQSQIRSALQFAHEEGIDVSIAGRRHSMGGQSFSPGALVLDMRGFNQMRIDENTGVLDVQTGATWRQVLDFINPLGYSVEAMQAIDILTVGGSVAVNAHGIDHRNGSIASSVRSLRIMLADGTVHEVSRTREPELFRAAIGGYGLFGVILDVKLSLTENTMYRFDSRVIDIAHFPALFDDEIDGNDNYRLMYVHLSTDPKTLLKEAILYTHRTVESDQPLPDLVAPGRLSVRGGRFMLNLAKTGRVGEFLKWWGQKHILPAFRQCYTTRNDALGDPEACLVSRNQALSQSLDLLKNKIPDDTDILQEYFVPRTETLPFLESMRQVLIDNDATLLNASVRVIHREDIMLNYAPEDMFSVVLYLNQDVSTSGNEKMARLTAELIDTAVDHGGTFYLPYQLHYTGKQLQRAYPGIDEFFALKRFYDPGELFKNTWYNRYAGDSESAWVPPGLVSSMPRTSADQLTGAYVSLRPLIQTMTAPATLRPRGPPALTGQ